MKNRIVTFVTMGLIALLCAACGMQDTSAQDDPSKSWARVAQGNTILTPQASCSGTYDGCLKQTSDDMRAMTASAIAVANRWAAAAYTAMPPVRNWYFIPVAVTPVKLRTQCRSTADDVAFFYCSGDDSVYIGEKSMWTLYHLGAAVAVAEIAHEFGHHIQQQAGIKNSDDNDEATMHLELQADCVSGVAMRYLIDSDRMLRFDITAMSTYFRDVKSDNRHGPNAERQRLYSAGFEGGLGNCNIYGNTIVNMR